MGQGIRKRMALKTDLVSNFEQGLYIHFWLYGSMNIKIAITFVVMTLFVASAGIVSSTVLAQQSQNAHFIANLSGKSAPPLVWS